MRIVGCNVRSCDLGVCMAGCDVVVANGVVPRFGGLVLHELHLRWLPHAVLKVRWSRGARMVPVIRMSHCGTWKAGQVVVAGKNGMLGMRFL